MVKWNLRLIKAKFVLLSLLCFAVAIFCPGWRNELKAQGYDGYDNEKPALAPEVNKTLLWPPNHKMVDIVIDAHAWDNSGSTVLNATVTSNEFEEVLGDGDASPDWTMPHIDQQTGIISLQLRAERSGEGNGRIYTIAITAMDPSNNSTTVHLNILVPHAVEKYKTQSNNTLIINSVVVSQASLQASYRLLSDLELAIKLNEDARLALAHQAQEAGGNTQLLLMYHQQEVKLEQELKRLEMEYQAIKTRLESDQKMKKDAIERDFKITP